MSTVQVGRHSHQLPEKTAEDYAAWLAARRAEERAKTAQQLADRDQEIRELKEAALRSNVEAICDARSEGRSPADRAALRAKVEAARALWCVAGRQGVFPVYDEVSKALHELGAIALAPAPRNASPLAASLATSERPTSAEDVEARAKAVAASRSELPDAYVKFGFENPALGSRNPGNVLGF
jgi:hypothetical protein